VSLNFLVLKFLVHCDSFYSSLSVGLYEHNLTQLQVSQLSVSRNSHDSRWRHVGLQSPRFPVFASVRGLRSRWFPAVLVCMCCTSSASQLPFSHVSCSRHSLLAMCERVWDALAESHTPHVKFALFVTSAAQQAWSPQAAADHWLVQVVNDLGAPLESLYSVDSSLLLLSPVSCIRWLD